MDITLVFSIIILIFSVIIHEVSHGFAAYAQGDNTAKYAGRLTLNPLAHLELFGSFILPLMSYFFGGFILGWAKPVPFNPYNLRNQRWGEALVALAGPASNICIALVFVMLFRTGVLATLGLGFVTIGLMVIQINLVLATFNLIPVPPLDGSKILFSLLPYHARSVRGFLEKNSTFILIFFIFFLWGFIAPVVSWEFTFLTGLSL